MATVRLCSLENQFPEDGDEYDMRYHTEQVQQIETLTRQLLSIVGILAECTTEKLNLSISVTELE